MAEAEDLLKDEIDFYLLGRMSKEESAAFKAKMEADPALQSEVEFQRSVIGAIRHARRNELKAYIRENAKKEDKPSRPVWIMAAAATVLALAAVSVLFFKGKKGNNDALAEKEIVAPPPPATPDGTGQTVIKSDTTTNQTTIKTKPKASIENQAEHNLAYELKQANPEERQSGSAPESPNQKSNSILTPTEWDTLLHVAYIESDENKNEEKGDAAPRQLSRPPLEQTERMLLKFENQGQLKKEYIFQGKSITIFGVRKTDEVEILADPEGHYLKLKGNIYQLYPTSTKAPLNIVNDPEKRRRLGL